MQQASPAPDAAASAASSARPSSLSGLKILLVEDEPALQQLLSIQLRHQGFALWVAADAAQAQQLQQQAQPDVAIVDWMLPGALSGVDLIRHWRNQSATQLLPIVLLTARSGEDDRIRGLECGADDYVCKPFSAPELVARVRALMRRAQPKRLDSVLQFGNLQLDTTQHTVLWHNKSLPALAPAEMRLLQHFMTTPQKVHSREQLLQAVWGANVHRDGRTVDMGVRRLRVALGEAGTYIETVWGVGYKLALPTPHG